MGVIFGLTISIFISTYFSKKGGLAMIQEDVSKIKDKIKYEVLPH
jgi:hypothetical protein